ncbi:hypothetical protein CBR_g70737 [Chara braunii]|uniref:Uncharacterized protein n=1 Tax=Chara braunii TaxID=69332 RepID=A0A388K9Y8_CHABU|nr:hypothetical protein CBR_g70737 [Chara braunii]|eukprot:GBG66860.1 hypothetical protein CBR_g70737 [Chara braunii]
MAGQASSASSVEGNGDGHQYGCTPHAMAEGRGGGGGGGEGRKGDGAGPAGSGSVATVPSNIGQGPAADERWSSTVANLNDLGTVLNAFQKLVSKKAVFLDEDPYGKANSNSLQTRMLKAQERRIKALEKEVDAAVAASALARAAKKQAEDEKRAAEERAQQFLQELEGTTNIFKLHVEELRAKQEEIEKKQGEIEVLKAIISAVTPSSTKKQDSSHSTVELFCNWGKRSNVAVQLGIDQHAIGSRIVPVLAVSAVLTVWTSAIHNLPYQETMCLQEGLLESSGMMTYIGPIPVGLAKGKLDRMVMSRVMQRGCRNRVLIAVVKNLDCCFLPMGCGRRICYRETMCMQEGALESSGMMTQAGPIHVGLAKGKLDGVVKSEAEGLQQWSVDR